MNIEKHIRNLLFEQNCVIIPDFGGFIANYISADIHPIRHTFIPPSKNIAFNEMLKVNDGLLISNISNDEQITREEATEAVKEFVEKIHQSIRMTGKYRFEDIGTLSLNHEQKLQFEPENTINYLTASFGLPDLQFRPIERQTAARINTKDRAMVTEAEFRVRENIVTPTPQIQTEKKAVSKWQASLLPVALFMAIAFGYFWFLDKGDNVLSKMNPFALFDKNFFATRLYPETDATKKADNASLIPEQNEWGKNNRKQEKELVKKNDKPEVQKPETTKVEKTEIAKPEPVKPEIKTPEKKPEPKKEVVKKERFYIIVGGFGSISNAEKLRKELTEEGHAAKVLPAGNNGLIKVSYEDYATESEANSVTETLKSRFSGAWVFKN